MHKTLYLKEYQNCAAPSEIFSESGEVLILPELLGKNFFSLRYKKNDLILQAGGFVGLFKLNNNLSIQVESKVNIKNFSRILALSEGAPSVLNAVEASYQYLMENIKSINEYLIESFLYFAEQVHLAGFYKEYSTITKSNSFPKGRIDFKKTFNSLNKTLITYSFKQRSIDTKCNEIVKWMLVELLKNDSFCRIATNKYKVIKLLNSLSKVTYVRFDKNELVRMISESYIERLTYTNYKNLFSIIKIIINQWSVDLLSVGKTKAHSIIINLEEVFEKYLLNSLALQNLSLNELSVLDGNKKGNNGGAKELFSETDDEFFYGESVRATPDIVVFSSTALANNIVIDVKYKVINNVCDRADLNQVVTYMSSYDSCAGVLLIPSHKNTKYKIQCLGSILGGKVYQYSFNLNADDIIKEEKELLCFLTKILKDNNS